MPFFTNKNKSRHIFRTTEPKTNRSVECEAAFNKLCIFVVSENAHVVESVVNDWQQRLQCLYWESPHAADPNQEVQGSIYYKNTELTVCSVVVVQQKSEKEELPHICQKSMALLQTKRRQRCRG